MRSTILIRAVHISLVIFFACGASAWGQPERAPITGQHQVPSADRPEQREEPIHITADRLEVNNATREAHFMGRVRAQQADVILHSDELIILYASEQTQQQPPSETNKKEGLFTGGLEGGKVQKIVAKGNVRVIQGNRTAEGEEAVYYSAERKIVLTGNPVIRQERDHIRGERVTVFLDRELSIIEGKGESRVQAVFYPEKGLTERGKERR